MSYCSSKSHLLRPLALLLLSVVSPKFCPADLPKAISLSQWAVPPGETTVVTVNGLNLTNTTELWTNLKARIQQPKQAESEAAPLVSALSNGKNVPQGTVVVEAETFDRGQYQIQGTFILNGNFTPNYAEWDFDIPADSCYVLELNYAAGSSRPVKLFVNGKLLTENAAAGVTGGFAESDAKWMAECVLCLKKGKNIIRLERPGGTPHFDKLALVPTDFQATQFSSRVVTATDRVAPFEFNVPAGTPVGIRGLRVATTEGISNQLLFMVDDLPTVNEIRGQTSGGNAQPIQLPVAIEGYCDVGNADRYSFHAEAGDKISFEVVATRLGSKLDPMIRLVSEQGSELAFLDDAPGMAGDCGLRYRFETAGAYIIEIEDSLTGGAAGHWYRLRIGDFPLISATLPAVVHQDHETPVTFGGMAVEELNAFSVPPVGDQTYEFVSATFPGKIGSGFAEVRTSKLPQIVISPGSSPSLPEIPCGISGVLAAEGDVHTCRFTASKGQQLVMRDTGRLNGSSTLLAITVRNGKNETLAEVRNAGLKGCELNWQAPIDGEYQLLLSDLNSRGGPNFTYYVEVQPKQNDFELSVELDSAILPPDGYTLLKVTANRKGYNGPINLTVNGLGNEVRLGNAVIAEKAQETRLKIYSPPDRKTGQTQTVEVIGTATIEDVFLKRHATTIAAMRKENPRTSFPPASLNGLIATVTGPVIPNFFSLTLDENPVLFPRVVGEVYFTVRVSDRAKGFKDPVNIRVEGLPDGFRASGGERPVSGSDNNEYRFQLSGPADPDLDESPIQIIAEASFKGQTKEVAIAKSQLRVVEPLLVSVAADGTLSAGATRTLKIAARRFVPRAGGDKKQIDVTFTSVPNGVTLPPSVVIPAGRNEANISIQIQPGVDLSTLSEILITARTIVKEQEVVVKSPLIPEMQQ